VGPELAGELGAGAVEAGLHGAQRQAGDVGDLLVGEVLEVAEDDEGALLFGQRAEVGLEDARESLRVQAEDRVLPLTVAGLGTPRETPGSSRSAWLPWCRRFRNFKRFRARLRVIR
jgi:hypothetical protein